MNIRKVILGLVSSLLMGLSQLLGGVDAPLKALFALMAADLITGMLKAALRKNQSEGLSSKTMFLGLGRKLIVLILVMMVVQLDSLLGLDSVSRLAVIGFYVANEALSIVENAAILGVPFPKQVLSSLEAMRDKEESKTNTNNPNE